MTTRMMRVRGCLLAVLGLTMGVWAAEPKKDMPPTDGLSPPPANSRTAGIFAISQATAYPDWPQWQGPNRTGEVANSPALLFSHMPEDLWRVPALALGRGRPLFSHVPDDSWVSLHRETLDTVLRLCPDSEHAEKAKDVLEFDASCGVKETRTELDEFASVRDLLTCAPDQIVSHADAIAKRGREAVPPLMRMLDIANPRPAPTGRADSRQDRASCLGGRARAEETPGQDEPGAAKGDPGQDGRGPVGPGDAEENHRGGLEGDREGALAATWESWKSK